MTVLKHVSNEQPFHLYRASDFSNKTIPLGFLCNVPKSTHLALLQNAINSQSTGIHELITEYCSMAAATVYM